MQSFEFDDKLDDKEPRFRFEEERRNPDGTLRKKGIYVIRHGDRKTSTGCGKDESDRALEIFEDYKQQWARYKYEREQTEYAPDRQRGRHPSQVRLADVLKIYLDDQSPKHARPKETAARIGELIEFFGADKLSTINTKRVDEYVAYRIGKPWRSFKSEDGKIGKTGRAMRLVTEAAARRELEDLRAAINYHRVELGLCSEVIAFSLPSKSKPRQEWITRNQAAKIIWAAFRHKETQNGSPTARYTLRHIARFMLVGMYTGTRAGAICAAGFTPAIDGRGYIDLEHGVFHRLPHGARETKKRQPSAPLPPRLQLHLERWRRLGIAKHAVVEWNGKPVASVRRAFARAVELAGV
ncbi:MAG TPA: hypothetical protein VKB78_03450, partial [Pirellulales bacterium]|nr:hypothetical protein [Pirellulales bacterium]